MKAQLSIETILTMIVFVGFLSYFFFQLLVTTPTYLREVKREVLNSEAFQLSELLINDEGEPKDWYTKLEVQRFGLSDETKQKTNLLSLPKINKFNSECQGNGYEKIKEKVDTDFDFILLLVERTAGEPTEPLINCKSSTTIGSTINVSIRRIVSFDENRYGELILQMW